MTIYLKVTSSKCWKWAIQYYWKSN